MRRARSVFDLSRDFGRPTCWPRAYRTADELFACLPAGAG